MNNGSANPGQLEGFKLAMESGKLHHAWLLAGPAGMGKKELTYKLATMLLSTPSHDPTKLIEGAVHPDLVLITNDAEQGNGEIKIDQVRKALTALHMAPVLAARKVVIINPADALNTNANNALLKTLEEPRPNTFFLLVTHSVGLLPATIRSRCAVLRFNMPTLEEFSAALSGVGINIHELYSMSGGSIEVARVLAEDANVQLIKRITACLSGDEVPLSELISLKKECGKDEVWELLTRSIATLQVRMLGDSRAKSEIVWRAYRALRLMNDQQIFNLEQENVALSILSQN